MELGEAAVPVSAHTALDLAKSYLLMREQSDAFAKLPPEIQKIIVEKV